MSRPQQPAVFLDRDGTIMDDPGYVHRVEDVAIYPWSADALRLLRRGGFAIIVITNQSGVARGLYPESAVHAVHAHLADALARGGASVDGWYHCPHHVDAVDAAYRLDCDCRKPAPGLLRVAAEELRLDLARSFVVGDRWHDVAAGHAVGARGLLVRTGLGRRDETHPHPGTTPDAIVDNVMEAAAWILQQP